MTWREQAQDVIQRIRIAHPQARADDLKKLLKRAYPFGQRQYWPYRVWCEEVAIATGKRARRHRGPRFQETRPEHPGQQSMF